MSATVILDPKVFAAHEIAMTIAKEEIRLKQSLARKVIAESAATAYCKAYSAAMSIIRKHELDVNE